MTTAYGYDLMLPAPNSLPSIPEIFKKRQHCVEIDETNAKLSKVCIEEAKDSKEDAWMHPSKVIASLYSHIIQYFRARETFSLCHMVRYKNKNAFLKLSIRRHPKYDDNFVFVIEIKSIRNESLCEYSAVYTWGGSCFKMHLHLLCWFNIDQM